MLWGPNSMRSNSELTALSALREKPSGNIRITTGEHAAETILWPALAKLLPEYPDIHVELVVDYGLTNIVAERYDAGVRIVSMTETNCAKWRRESVPVGLREKGCEAPIYFHASMPIHILVARSPSFGVFG